MTVNNKVLFLSDGFTFVKRHQAALIQRLKSVEPVLEHLREQNVLCMFLFVLQLLSVFEVFCNSTSRKDS